MRIIVTCGNKDKYLECGEGLVLFGKVLAVGSSARSMTSQVSHWLARFPVLGVIFVLLSRP